MDKKVEALKLLAQNTGVISGDVEGNVDNSIEKGLKILEEHGPSGRPRGEPRTPELAQGVSESD